MSCNCQSFQGLNDEVTDRNLCVEAIYNYLNNQGQEWYTRPFIEDVVFTYQLFVTSGQIQPYDRDASPGTIPQTEAQVISSVGADEGQIKAVLYAMWQLYKSGTIKKNCIFPGKAANKMLAFAGVAVVLGGVGLYLYSHSPKRKKLLKGR